MKYRVTFQLKKCEFFTNRIKYVGHDITPTGNCPAQSKFDLITDWPLLATGQSLGAFIGLVSFYNIYALSSRFALSRSAPSNVHTIESLSLMSLGQVRSCLFGMS